MPLPTVILPGYFASAPPYRGMEQMLRQLGFPAVTVPLTRSDWVPTLGGRSVQPIIAKIDRTVQQVRSQYDTDQVNLVGHSAGGWIARLYLGDVPYDIHDSDCDRTTRWSAHHWVSTLVTLGTPHTSQERWTRKNLDFVNQTYPGAFHTDVRYACFAGKAVFGRLNWQTWIAFNSYTLTGGRGDCWGDGITPIQAAHLEGADNITLEAVYHSPRPGIAWYGTPKIVQTWASYLQ